MGEVPLLQAENADVSTTMSRQQITEVPNPGNDLTCIRDAHLFHLARNKYFS